VYADDERAASYARLEFPGTYHLAFRDLPAVLAEHAPGRRALDFGCGAGRSTRFLRALGFDVEGADVSAAMLARARASDPEGRYLHVADGGLDRLGDARYDLILSAFTFDNVPGERKAALIGALADRLAPGGRFVNLVSAPELYVHEWASFSTRDFPANRTARSGDPVRIVMLDVDDRRPVDDVLCTDDAYRELYARAGLEPVRTYRPLGRGDEPFAWVSETTVPPWAIYVLRGAGGG
jgi:SAM-dependent methyltransferase